MNNICSVEELNNQIRDTIKLNFGKIMVRGEIANIKISNGNLYGLLKDQFSSINIIIWKNNQNTINSIQNGDKIIANGIINFYTKNGSYNLIIDSVEKLGTGDIHLELEHLKQKCQKYFDKTKKISPKYIHRLGILTAIDGAALQDILYVLKKNDFKGQVLIKNCFVQGKKCSESIVSGIKYFENIDCDVL
jgi:exodeoxyribonuclease VII large subunit